MFNFGKIYKDLEAMNNGFWSVVKILSYGRPNMIVTGSRSVGKSTQTAALCLLTYIKLGRKFMYIRRRPIDVQKTYKTFFNNAIAIVNKYCDCKKIEGFRAYKGSYWIAFSRDEDDALIWEECGCYVALSQEENYKSSVYSEYVIMVYDEFISKDKNKYLGTKENIDAEWDAICSLYQSVDRGVDTPYRNETALFLLGNKSTVYNPVALSIGLVDYVRKGARFTAPKGKVWIWEDIDHVDATVNYEDSYSYQMSSDRVKKYAYENEGEDTTHFIKHPGVAMYVTTLRFRNQEYGVYYDSAFDVYIDKPKAGYAVLSLDLMSHNGSDIGLIRKWNDNPTLVMLSKAFAMGNLYFGNGKIQALFLKYLEFMQ